MAIWFALEKHKRLGLAVLYAVDLDNLPGGIREVGHRKLAMQPYVELNCRWVVQSGVMLVPTEWPQMTAAEELNLRGLADSTSVRRFEFAPSPGDRAIIHGNPMNTESDWIAPLVRDVILFVAEGLKASHPVIRRHIEMIGEGAG
jgi:hypothetical protein